MYNSVFSAGCQDMKSRIGSVYLIGLLLGACIIFTLAAVPAPPDTSADSWPYYGHDAGGMRYSPLTQINRDNVSTLKVAWTFHTGDISEASGRRKRSGFETTPLLFDGSLYLTTAFYLFCSLDPRDVKSFPTRGPTDELGCG